MEIIIAGACLLIITLIALAVVIFFLMRFKRRLREIQNFQQELDPIAQNDLEQLLSIHHPKCKINFTNGIFIYLLFAIEQPKQALINNYLKSDFRTTMSSMAESDSQLLNRHSVIMGLGG